MANDKREVSAQPADTEQETSATEISATSLRSDMEENTPPLRVLTYDMVAQDFAVKYRRYKKRTPDFKIVKAVCIDKKKTSNGDVYDWLGDDYFFSLDFGTLFRPWWWFVGQQFYEATRVGEVFYLIYVPGKNGRVRAQGYPYAVQEWQLDASLQGYLLDT